ncbi:MAG: serine/threonine-protein kinase [Sumerlaeia bacterium]
MSSPHDETLLDESLDRTLHTECAGEVAAFAQARGHEPLSFEDKAACLARRAGFEVLGTLGKGGMGAVLKARDRELGRTVALKLLISERSGDAQAMALLKREAERASALNHENIVQVYSWHTVGDLMFFAMEWVDGESLAQYVNRLGPLAPREALRILSQAADALAAAHGEGLLHRDIKPANIMITRAGRAKLTDFGIASSLRDDPGETEGRIEGTLSYMAPEQGRGEALTYRSDVFALAGTLYFALTGRSPMSNQGGILERLEKVRRGETVPIEKVREDLPSKLVRFVTRNLDPAPAHRAADAGAFKREAERLLLTIHDKRGGRKALLRAPSWLELALVIAVFIGGLLAGGAGVLAWQAREPRPTNEQMAFALAPELRSAQRWLASQPQTDIQIGVLAGQLHDAQRDGDWNQVLRALDEIRKVRESQAPGRQP